MWMSMTGFGRGDHHAGEVSVTAEVRSVNHRFLDIHVRCPAKFFSWEMRVRSLVRETLKRGKVDVFLSVREWGKGGTTVRVNHGLLSSFLAEAKRVREEYSLAMDLSFRDLIQIPDLFVFAPDGNDPAEEHWTLAEDAVRSALDMVVGARREEGKRLRAAIERSVRALATLTEEMTALAGENKELARARLLERIEALSGEAGIDPARLQQEAPILIDRLDISEECDRLRSHLAGMEGLLKDEGEAVGKRFDFLVQEAFREMNTASSKSAHAGGGKRGETDGKDYYFIKPEKFDKMVNLREFLEFASVYGNRYGTSREAVRAIVSRGRDAVLEIDVQGGRKVKQELPGAVLVAIFPPDWRSLEKRVGGGGGGSSGGMWG